MERSTNGCFSLRRYYPHQVQGVSRLRIVDFELQIHIRIQYSEIRIRRDSQPCGSPENFVDTVYYILVNLPTRRSVKYRRHPHASGSDFYHTGAGTESLV